MKKILAFLTVVTMILSSSITAFAEGLVCVNDGSNPDIPVSNIVAQFSGHGDQVIQGADLPAGYAFKLSATHNGKSNFIMKEYIDDDRGGLLINKIGSYAGTVLFNDGKMNAVPNYMIEVKADGDWSIVIATVTNATASTMQGSGDKVSGLIAIPANTVATLTHDGKSNFIVKAYKPGDKYGDLLVNTIGAYSGQTIVKGKKKTMTFLEVRADGNWTISIGAPSDPCVVPDVN